MKRLLAVILLVGLSGLGLAQININPQIGMNVSKLTNVPQELDPFVNFSSIVGYQIGGNIRIGGNLHLQPGFYWHELGSELKISDIIPDDLEDKIKINIIQIPVLIGYKLINLGLLEIRLNAGPSLSFVSSVKDNIFGLEKDHFRDTIWGAMVGAGVDILFISADISYEFGLSNTVEIDINDDNEPEFESKNNVFRLNAGIKL